MGDYCPALPGGQGVNDYLAALCTSNTAFCLTAKIDVLAGVGTHPLPPCSNVKDPCTEASDSCCPRLGNSTGTCTSGEPFATSALTRPPTFTMAVDCVTLGEADDNATLYNCHDPYKAFFNLPGTRCPTPLSGGTWTYCATTNPLACPVFTGVGQREHYYLDEGVASRTQHTQVCTYDPTALMYDPTGTMLNAVLTEIQTQGNAYDAGTGTRLLTNYCALTSPTCPADLKTKECSRFVSQDGAGATCRNWFQQDPTTASQVMTSYCASNPTAPECTCLDPTLDPAYKRNATELQALINNQPYPCWFLPCKSGDTYLRTKEIRDTTCQAGNLCVSIYNFVKDTDINIHDLNTMTGCNFGGGGTTPTFWQKYRWWVLGFIAFLILIVIIIVVVDLTHRGKK